MLGAAYGIPITLCMPSNVSKERKRILSAYRRNSHLHRSRRRLRRCDPQGAGDCVPRSRRNITTPISIPTTPTGARIMPTEQRMKYGCRPQGASLILSAILGTSGTFVGTSRRLKELNPAIRCISLQPDSPFHGIEGTKHMETSIVPKIYDASIADAELGIETEAAYTMARRRGARRRIVDRRFSGRGAGWRIAGCTKKHAADRSSLPSFPTRATSI